jgi:translocation and assembly module TamB
MELEGSWAAPRGALRVNGRAVSPVDPSGVAPPGPYEARIEMAIEARRIIFQTVEVKGAHAQLQGAGVWQDYPAFDQWPAGRPAAEGTVAMEGRFAVPDLGWLARGFKDIRRVAGRLEAEVKVEGPLRDPRLQADLRLTDGELRPEADMPPLQALNLKAGFTGRNLEIQHLQGELGGAPFQVTGAIENLMAPEGGLRLNLRLKGDDLLLHRSRTFRARASTDLRLSGPLERLELAGTLTLTDGLFTQPLGLAEGLTAGSARPKVGPGFSLFSIESPPFRDMRFDVQIGSARPFLIKNNLAKGAVRPDLRLVGTGEAPELVGKIYLDPTVLFLPAGRMQFDSGVIRFEAVDPGRPRLDMVGTARMIGYDITATVEGPYDEPSVALSSAPPLPDAELLALVLTGQPPKTPGSESVEKRQGLNVAVFIGRDILMRMPGGGTTESLQTVLERFDGEVGRSLTRAGDETINARFRVADDVLREKDTLYLTGEKDVFDHFNAGVRIVFRFR